MNKLPLFSALLAGLVAAGSACADMIFYEPFDQSPGTLIKDDASWSNIGAAGGADPDVVSGTLEKAGVSVAGNKGRFGLNSEGVRTSFTQIANDSLFLSFLFRVDDIGNSRNDSQRFANLYSTSGADVLGELFFEGFTGDEVHYQLQARVFNESLISSGNLSTGVTYQLVMRYDHSTTGNDSLEVWLDPGANPGDGTLWNATSTDGAPGGGLDRLDLRISEDWDGNSLFYLDEVVLADSWEDARNLSLVPEPGSFALVFSALLMVRFLRRRRT